ncbi:lipopolysaccharide biosynthesis protein [uncultured Eubacterium sp.]|uniref:lipopolysaccharide biosynthesis protein n=1 Tax=uncultured Eubacterium sp. TaxID=165185 RepID=UPI0025D59A9C|nr:lipopolysaccharide biosynthesis protein [uncultured Eubacterium sp.]
MEKKIDRNTTIGNFFWRFAERCGAQLVQFIVSIILARLLAPEVYGTIALITVFTTILNVFVDSGMGNALIQKKDADNLDFSTVFFFNVCVCAVLYGVMFFAATGIAKFYHDVSLIPVIRVLSLTLVISGVKNVQQAYVSRTMQFKRFFFSTLGGTIGAAIIGIIMAYNGFGVWALVMQQIFNAAVDTAILWITVKWRPQKSFSFKRLKALLSFGWKLLVSALLDNIYTNIRQLIIGRMYSASDLAFYNRGKQFPDLLITNINTSIDSVLLPTMSREQDDLVRLKAMMRRAIKTSTYIMAPLMMGLAFCGTPLIRFILTEKWLPCVPFMQIFCITSMFYPIHTANLNAVNAMGRSDIFLKLEIAKKTVGMVLLISTMWFGVMAMAYSLLVSSVLNQIINSWPNKKLLNYGYLEQLKDILPGISLAVVMGICVYLVQRIGLPDILTLCIQVVLGITIYLGGSKLFKLESYEYLLETIKPYIKNKLYHK